jgi:hypothetical protein
MLPDFQKEQDIIAETKQWSKVALETSNEYYNNLPPCPFAKKAWVDQKVGFCFKYDKHWQDLYSLISQWDDTKDVVILVDFNYLPLNEMDEYLNLLNDAISEGMFINKDMFLMGFHPDDEDNELLDDTEFDSTIDQPYAMIFLQRLSKLQEASNTLRIKGYYQIAETYYNGTELYKNRERLYRRLKNGDEKS